MKRWTNVTLAICTAAALGGCADREVDRPASDSPPAVGTSGAADPVDPARPGERSMDRGDSGFVADMMTDSQSEIALAKLAQEKATNPKVKEFAAMMIRDHTKAGGELKALAASAGIDASVHADADHDADLSNRLAKLSGAEFDREYMDAMVDNHEKAVNDAEERAEDADNDHVKQWANKTLPTLKQHLELAKQINQGIEKSGS
jgi:putative membrane protein